MPKQEKQVNFTVTINQNFFIWSPPKGVAKRTHTSQESKVKLAARELLTAIESMNLDRVEKSLKNLHLNLNQKNLCYGQPLLHIICRTLGEIKISQDKKDAFIEKVLSTIKNSNQSVNWNSRDRLFIRLSHILAERGFAKSLAFVCRLGVSIDEAAFLDNEQLTPVELAQQQGHKAIENVLEDRLRAQNLMDLQTFSGMKC